MRYPHVINGREGGIKKHPVLDGVFLLSYVQIYFASPWHVPQIPQLLQSSLIGIASTPSNSAFQNHARAPMFAIVDWLKLVYHAKSTHNALSPHNIFQNKHLKCFLFIIIMIFCCIS